MTTGTAASQQRLPENLASGLALKQLPALDGLRAVAAFLVVFYHSASALIPGGLGVLAFFVLSGFLITWLLLDEQDRYGGISIKLFYARRSFRIFPAFYAYWILLVARTTMTGKIHWPQAICSFFYVNNYYQALAGDPNAAFSHTWSLGIEEQFYLLWPASFVFLRRFPRERVVRILLGLIGAVWVYRWFLHFILQVNQGYIYEAFDARFDHLLCGCALAFALRVGAYGRLWKRLCADVTCSILILGMLVLSVVLSNTYGTGYRNVVGFVVDPVLIALLIPQLIALRRELVWKWLNWPVIRYLGRISYSVYLYQQVTPSLVGKVSKEGTLTFVAANAMLVIAVATASYFLIERPFLGIKDRFARTQRVPA